MQHQTNLHFIAALPSMDQYPNFDSGTEKTIDGPPINSGIGVWLITFVDGWQ
ncbi:unnamed protein product [Rhodiola kirilowii]